MKLNNGNGLYVLVSAKHIMSIANHRHSNPEAIMKNMAEVKLTNGDTYTCLGSADALYSEMKLELNMGKHA